jgi:hypothetical protein
MKLVLATLAYVLNFAAANEVEVAAAEKCTPVIHADGHWNRDIY